MRSEIENEVRQEMEVRRKQQEVELRQEFERYWEGQVGKVIEEQKKILDEERKRFLVELTNARDTAEAAIKRAEKAAEERDRMSDMLEQAKTHAGRVEDEAAKAAQQAEGSFNTKLNHFSLELERARSESEAAINTGREAMKAVTGMRQELEMARSHAQWVEAEANKVASHYKQGVEEEQNRLSLEIERLRQQTEDKAEEVRRLSETLNAAYARTQQAEEAAAMAAETARIEIQKAHGQADNARRRAGDTFRSGQPAPQAEVAQPIPHPDESDNQLDFDRSVQRLVQGDQMETDEESWKDWDDDQPDAHSRRRKSKSRATEQESDIESETPHIANKWNSYYFPESDADSAGTVRLLARQAPVQTENKVNAEFSGSE